MSETLNEHRSDPMNGLHLTPERIAELQKICEALSAPRSGSDSGEHDWRRFYAHAQHAFPHALSDLATLRAEVKALAAWQCESCGARFAESVNARLLVGVRRCSACVELSALKAENERLRGIVDKLPKTADGVPVVDGMKLYLPDNHRVGYVMEGHAGFGDMVAGRAWMTRPFSDCYSTPEAAEAARAKGGA